MRQRPRLIPGHPLAVPRATAAVNVNAHGQGVSVAQSEKRRVQKNRLEKLPASPLREVPWMACKEPWPAAVRCLNPSWTSLGSLALRPAQVPSEGQSQP